MNTSQIEKYFTGETSAADEQEILQYFTSENVASKHIQYQNYFLGLGALKENSKQVIPEEEYVTFSPLQKHPISYIKHFGIALAVAASFALLLMFFPSLYKSQDFVVINGKKYTDAEHIALVFNTALENVKLDVKQIFEDLDEDIFY